MLLSFLGHNWHLLLVCTQSTHFCQLTPPNANIIIRAHNIVIFDGNPEVILIDNVEGKCLVPDLNRNK